MLDRLFDILRKERPRPSSEIAAIVGECFPAKLELAAASEAAVSILGHIIKAGNNSASARRMDAAGFDVLPSWRIDELLTAPAMDVDSAAGILAGMPHSCKLKLLRCLIQMAHEDDSYTDVEKAVLLKTAAGIGVDSDGLRNLERQTAEDSARSKRMLGSTAGLFAAIAIMGLFVLTAYLISSVIFGLILAYFLLPAQRLMLRKVFRAPPGPVSGAMVNLSCHATLISVAAIVLALVLAVGWVTTTYVIGAGDHIASWLAEGRKTAPNTQIQMPNPNADEDSGRAAAGNSMPMASPIVYDIRRKLEEVMRQVESSPIVKPVLDKLRFTLDKDESWLKLGQFVVSESTGIFFFTKGMISTIGGLAVNAAFTLVFALFFFYALASLGAAAPENVSPGRYLVSSAFESGWLPRAGEETRRTAVEIIDGVAMKLGAWARGYLWIILIQTVYYCLAFLAIGIPYSIPLGILAGSTILLPFIGPIILLSLTVLVCLAGGVGAFQIAACFAVFLIMNGIVEQLVLFPKLVGASLGLGEFETIFVVLLGGILGGLTGMIFAVPAAAVLKFLIPKLYSCWNPGD